MSTIAEDRSPGQMLCTSSGTPQAPVLAPLLEDELAAGDAIAALRRYSLITLAAGGSVSVHRLVQAVTADQTPAQLAEAWQQAAATLIEAAIPTDTALPGAWPVCAALLPHAQAALADDSAGMTQIARYLGVSGSYTAARNLLRRVLAAQERVLGPNHPSTLANRHDLAYWTGAAGDPAGARDQYAALLSVSERVLGPEHSDTLIVRGNLAIWTGAAGDPAAARDLFAQLLPVQKRVLGPEHPDTLTTRHDLARWTGQAGDPAAARDLFAALLPVRERISGPEHPDTLTTRHELARWTGEAEMRPPHGTSTPSCSPCANGSSARSTRRP
jgi:Tetratricopeptide repeat